VTDILNVDVNEEELAVVEKNNIKFKTKTQIENWNWKIKFELEIPLTNK